jgi:hypothetical protein
MKNDARSSTSKPSLDNPVKINPARGANNMVLGSANPLVLTDRALKRRAARFLARLRRSVLPAALLLAAASAWGKAPVISATLDPAEIAFGDSAQLTVTVQGQEDSTPQVPAVTGLSFQPMGQSSQIQIINGAMSANISHTYVVTPSRLGTFTIPGITVGSGREAAQTQPLVLKVLQRAASAAQSSPHPGAGPSALPAPAVTDGDEDSAAPSKDTFGFLRLISPKKEFYVGEMVPVELKAFFRAGAELRVDGLPKLNSDAFTMNKLSDQPARSQQVIGGVPYTVFTWPTAITAVKAGDYELSIEIPTTVTVRQHVQRPRTRTPNPFGDPFFDDVFNDPFFDNFFGSATQKEVALSSPPSAVKILSLPLENRPAGFTGAVGQFDLAAEATPTQVAAGDPVTLKVKITGAGNFDRVNAPALEKSDGWKTYKPSAKFEPGDSAGFAGTKTFEQALVPERAGKVEIPALAFSFFNPDTRQYATRTSAAISVEVAPGQPASTSSTLPSDARGAQRDRPSRLANAVPELVPNKLAPGHFTPTLRPWFFNPWLAGGGLLLLGTLLTFDFILRRRQALARDPDRLRLANTRSEIQTQLKIMESAVSQGAVAEFFAAARGAFQFQLGLLWNLPPRTITLAEINSRMNGQAEGFRFVFELADEVTYTGRTLAPGELRKWFHTVNTELKKLEAQ